MWCPFPSSFSSIFVGIGEAEVKQLLVAEIIDRFIESVAQVGGDFLPGTDLARFGVIVVLRFTNLKSLHSLGIRELDFGDRAFPTRRARVPSFRPHPCPRQRRRLSNAEPNPGPADPSARAGLGLRMVHSPLPDRPNLVRRFLRGHLHDRHLLGFDVQQWCRS